MYSYTIHDISVLYSTALTLAAGCKSEQNAAVTLGYTRLSWDNVSGKEEQPDSAAKAWADLTREEQAAAVALGYMETIWDNKSGKEKEPDSAAKFFAELTTCGQCLINLRDIIALYPQGSGTERTKYTWHISIRARSRL